MNKVVIDRATWVTGRYKEFSSMLLNPAGQRCCLGFLGQSCGLKDYDATVARPRMVSKLCTWPQSLFIKNLCLSKNYLDGEFEVRMTYEETFIRINDAPGIDDDTRESWIAEGFKTALDYEVEFVGEYPK